MERFLTTIGAGLALFAAFSSSTSYNLNSYSVGPAGTSNSHSTTYYTQSTGGEVAGGKTSSTNYSVGSGNVQTEQLSVPLAPTLGNGSGTYYNQLKVTLNNTAGSSSYPTDTTFAIAISTTNCFTSSCIGGAGVQFVQTGGILGSSQFYQSYSAWGSGSGSTIVGLTSSTIYYVAIAAKQGTFTNTAYGASATLATVSPSVTFSVSPNSLSLGSLLPGTVVTSGTVTFGLATNGVYGANIYNAGQNSGLNSPSKGTTISALTGNLAVSAHGFGLQGVSTAQTSGGPLSIDSPYNGVSNNVGTESTTYTPIFTTAAPIVTGSATMNMQAKSSSTDPAGTDYQETMTFIAAASF